MKPLSPEAERLHQLYRRILYSGLGIVWVVVGLPCLWMLRLEIRRMIEFFTWASLKYALFYKPQWPSIGVLFCIGFTLYVMISQSRYELFGLMPSERDLLEIQVNWIRRLPPDHPLRRQVIDMFPRLPPGSE